MHHPIAGQNMRKETTQLKRGYFRSWERFDTVGLGACRGCIPKPKTNMKRSHLINSDTNAKASLIILL